MRFFRDSTTVRIAIAFTLLSLLPLAITLVLVMGVVREAFVDFSGHVQQRLAMSLAQRAAALAPLGDFSMLVEPGMAGGQVFFLVDAQGNYMAHSEAGKVAQGQGLRDDFSADVVHAILSGQPGHVIDARQGLVVGYAPVAGSEYIGGVLEDTQVLLGMLRDVTHQLFVGFVVGVILVSLAGSLVMWFLVGSHLLNLAGAARRIGEGDLATRVDADHMDGELGVLGRTFNQMSDHLQVLVAGLEQRVAELDLARQSLSASEQRFRSIFDSVNEAILVQNIDDGKIHDANRRAEEMYGFSRETLLQCRVDDLS